MTAPASSLSDPQVVLDIEGMTCAACVNRLERVLARVPAVVEARVSLATRTATVRGEDLHADRLIEAVAGAGYGASVHRPGRSALAEVKDYERRLVVAGLCSAYVIIFSQLIDPHSRASLLLAWLFATPVQFYAGWPFLRRTVANIRHGTNTMDTLVGSGSLASYAYSVMAVFNHGHAHFDTAAVIVTLILLGKVLEARARARAGDAAQLLLERQPTLATRITDGEEHTVQLADLQVGDLVVVRPGEQIPADGVVETGRSSVDVAVLTGESAPVDVGPGDDVVGGALNADGRLLVRLARVGADTKMAQVVRLLEVTQASKAPIQRLADRVAAVFVPRVMAIAAAVFIYHYAVQPSEALMHGAAVLLVACPCALGLATPVAIMVGSGRAAELGILFKGGEVFEAGKNITAVLIDKTGTLTEGNMTVTEVMPAAAPADEVLALAAAAEQGSEHPLARAVVQAATDHGLTIPAGADHRAERGAGITARVNGHDVRVGRPDDLPAPLTAAAASLADRGLTVVAVWRDGDAIGLLGAFDRVKESAPEAVQRLRDWGRSVAVVSGDRRATVEAAAAQVGVDDVTAEVFPDGKVAAIRRLQSEGERVAFVGDGVNDAPALAQADLGIALGTGTDVAIEAGQVLIMGGDLGLVADALELAGRTYWVIAQNLAWAFAYNLLMIPLAAAGKVAPLVAAAAMAGSSVTVVCNALRLRRFGGRRPTATEDAVEPPCLVPSLAPVQAETTGASRERATVPSMLGDLLARPWEV